MTQTSLRCSVRRVLFPIAATFIFTSVAFGAAKEFILHSFNGQHAISPLAGLVRDSAGNLYGTSSNAGNICPPTCGTVFELSPSSKGWKYRVIHNFTGGTDGLDPRTALVFDSKGNLYGSTASGGITTGFCESFQGCGTLFELSPNSSGGWDEKVIYRFEGTTDGAFPISTLVFDANGNLYGGTAAAGGTTTCEDGCGTVFKLTPSGNGWSFSVIHAFDGADGNAPNALVFGANGTLYGSAATGGDFCSGGCGVVFQLVPNGNNWVESVLYSFTGGSDGNDPLSLVRVTDGTLYGQTGDGGSLACNFGCGNVFALTNNGSSWDFSIVHSFSGPDGAYPSGLTLDPEDNIYGTTFDGGGHDDCFDGCGLGVLFKLTPKAGGGWTETVLHRFTGGRDGGQPFGSVTFDGSGNLYGTASNGGTNDFGVVYEVVP